MSSEGASGAGSVGVGASCYAHELAKRRVSSTLSQTPTTPVTPLAVSTPVLAAHIFSEGNIMEDLQLAAELGKTLLERNKDLESTIKEQRSIIDDKTQEIEYLSKQTAALREVNDSRLRIYEQLEISIQDLENSNQRLTAEASADKKKIKSLTATIEQLEGKCDELQKSLDDAKALHQYHQHKQQQQQHHQEQQQQQQDRGRVLSRRILSPDESALRRSMSCENSSECCEDLATECVELHVKLESLQSKLKLTQEEFRSETKRREDLEIELECSSQENAVLREQILVLKEKDNNVRSFEDELASVDDTSSSKICRKCMGLADDTGSNVTMQDFTDDIDNTDTSFEDIQGDCALVRLKNGGYAWGSQESLASMGQVVNCILSNSSSPRTDVSEAPNSLLSELDTQYRILIEKYEALLEAREQREVHEKVLIQPPPPQTFIDSGIDEISGPMSLVMTEINANERSSVFCQRCTTCTCDLKLSTPRPKSNMEEHSEVETSSSGFSEGETRLCSKMTQTEYIEYSYYNKEFEDAATPTPCGNNAKYLDFQTPMNPCESRFQTAPIYRKIFHEIFEVLKKDVDKENVEIDANTIIMKVQDSETIISEDVSVKQNRSNYKNAKISDIFARDENKIKNKENKNPNARIANKAYKEEKVKNNVGLEENSPNVDLKPIRPDFLDLDNSSRCSSRTRRRRRQHKHRHTNNPQQTIEQDQKKPMAPEECQTKKSTSEAYQTKEPAIEEIQIKDLTTKECQKSAEIKSFVTELSIQETESELQVPVNSPAVIPSPTSESSTQLKQVRKSKDPQVISNSRKETCEHKRRKNKKQNRLQQPFQNKQLSKLLNSKSTTTNSRYQNSPWSSSNPSTAPQNLPSVQVAKLIKFERTYAEVLKSRRS